MACAGHVEIRLSDLSRINLEPGDVLVFRHEKRISKAERDSIKAQCAEVFPGHLIAVLEGGLELAVLRPVEPGVASAPAHETGT